MRDPVTLFSEKIDQSFDSDSDHFEVRLSVVYTYYDRVALFSEHTVHQLAEHEIQASSPQFTHWLEGGVQTNGGADFVP